ncbi:hypothetical protein FH972_023363 [Carpinus fangiana]|uniref:Major facilitator superfamily (MFS) profile domain-containing protein n=1 Tax=Carpinus fangiana TaxID=176857 RepID=A0A5N6KV03_9ROSI|nr:hypothetical protein FH972_023363 [Carpinus fangiana]
MLLQAPAVAEFEYHADDEVSRSLHSATCHQLLDIRVSAKQNSTLSCAVTVPCFKIFCRSAHAPREILLRHFRLVLGSPSLGDLPSPSVCAQVLALLTNASLSSSPFYWHIKANMAVDTAGFLSHFKEATPADTRALALGAELAEAGSVEGLTVSEAACLEHEEAHKWASLPFAFWLLTTLNGMCAILQGMAAFSCWLTCPLNKHLGRRGTVFICCVVSAFAAVGQGIVNSWEAMFGVRMLLGLAVGPVSGTVPMFTGEVAPARIRGACVMFWQIFTAFGIMMGFVVSLMFQTWAIDANLGKDVYQGVIHDPHNITGLGWRLTMASPVVPSIIIASFIWFIPESPRWYMYRGEYDRAFGSLCRLRKSSIQAARDCYLVHLRCSTELKASQRSFLQNMRQIFVCPRNRRAMYASESLMFMQQFSGINVIAYYSSEIFKEAGFSTRNALLASFGFGATNFVFALPAFFTIDSYGRRALLLVTFPVMSLCLLMTGLGFIAPAGTDARTGIVAAGIYLFTAFYSSGAGPMPFTYSAEAYSQEVKNEGMALATATTWGFNSILALTWPSVLAAFGPLGAFCYYAAWNMIGYLLTLFLVPETKGKTLEDLDVVFSVATARRAKHAAELLAWGPPKSFSYLGVTKDPGPKPALPDGVNPSSGQDVEKVGDSDRARLAENTPTGSMDSSNNGLENQSTGSTLAVRQSINGQGPLA